MSTTLSYCPGCGEFVAAGEPCACVFVDRGTMDAQGILHTAKRVRVFMSWHDPDLRPPQRLLDRALEVQDSVAWIEDHGWEGGVVWEPEPEFPDFPICDPDVGRQLAQLPACRAFADWDCLAALGEPEDWEPVHD